MIEVDEVLAHALLMRTMAGSQIKSWGMRLMRTKGRRRAVVAVARKLAVLLHRMWTDGTSALIAVEQMSKFSLQSCNGVLCD